MEKILTSVKKITFKNGFTLILFPRPDSALLAINLCMNLGNLFESEEERGISALMQEVLLKGTQRQSAIDFNRAVENLGATIDSSSNYFTGRVIMQGSAINTKQMLQLFFEAIKSP
ncbi:MAG TPA: insulinase family protein, partial [Candidatus Atribacteria bacterium]|nr:insulinase family protein [Candidatus Atribacteria bacterium]